MSDTQNGKKLPSSLERARIAAKAILDNKGEDVRILDLREITQAFDFFVVGSGVSRRQLHAISDEIDDAFQKEMGDKRRGVAGYQESRWIVLDYGDVVVHLFEPETRDFYALEDLWGKGKDVPLEEDGAAVEPVSEAPVKWTDDLTVDTTVETTKDEAASPKDADASTADETKI